LLLTGPVLVAAALIVFVAMRLIPGDPVEVMMGERATTAEISRVRARLGLDLPLCQSLTPKSMRDSFF
jgi:peptide/nickel transport system permease protein